MTPDIIAALAPIADAFEGLEIPYCIGGSVASSYYGVLRRTNDIDLVVAFPLAHVEIFIDWLSGRYYVDNAMIQDAIRRKASFNLIHLDTGIKIDCFIPKETPFSQEQLRHVVEVALIPGTRTFAMASPEDTILAKLDWYRKSGNSERQWSDIHNVLKRQDVAIDFAYLRQMAPLLGVADLLERAISEA